MTEKPKNPEKVAAGYKGEVTKIEKKLEEKPKRSNFLSRKFILTILLILVGVGLVVMNKVDGMEFLIFSATIAGIYGVANVGQKVFTEE